MRSGLLRGQGATLLAALCGLGVTTLEFAAARQLAPAFGQSQHVWAAVIALLLGALAAGNALGGRLAAREDAPRRVGALLVGGALWTLGASLGGPALAAALTPTGLPATGGLPLGLLGSLGAALPLFAPPLVALGLPTPLLVARAGADGRGAGRLYAAGTVGALAGCWLTPLVLLQTWGTARTLQAAALLTLAVGAALWAAGRRAVVAAGTAPAPPTPPTPLPPEAPLGGGRALLVAGGAGAVVLALELVAVRLFAPWFGQSNRIWANVIGVVLFALALGGWLGARLAGAGRAARALPALLAGAALLLPVAALAGPALAEALVPRGIDAMHILPVAFAGSLAAAALLLAPAAVLLGAVPAVLVPRLAATHGAGRAAGWVSAAGTLGSVGGTFLGPLVLVPWLGSPRTLLLLALALLALALLARPRGALPALLVLALGLLGLPLLPWGPVRTHPGQLEEVESAYQSVRVVAGEVMALRPEGPPSGGGRGEELPALFLRHDEDAETYQSLLFPDAPPGTLTGGRYYEQMALGTRLAPGEPGRPLRALIVGYAGGALHRVLRDTLPPGRVLEVLGVEIDPEVVAVSRRHLRLAELEGPGLRLVTGEDARTVVNALPADERFDLVLVDAYARTNYIPFQLATREFFARVRRHLAPGGWVGVNVLGTGLNGPVCRAVATTLDAAVGPTFLHPNLWFPGNVILWSAPGAETRPRLHVPPGEALPPLLEVTAFALERLGVRHVPATDGGVLLTDDRSPSDRLADEELGL